jgi:acyl-CoA thioester hydrolase
MAEPGDAVVPPAGAFHTTLRVHFSDCDAQGIVFNAHYLRFVDNTVEQWFDSIPELGEEGMWDFVVKRAEVEWQSSARPGDHLDVAAWVSRWGTTSFSTTFVGSIGERPVFTTTLVYVTIDLATGRPVPVPDLFRTALG